MDPESMATANKNAPRKVRFAPKGPPRRAQKTVPPKVEKVEDDVDAAQAELLRRFNEASVKVKPKAERKGGSTQVAFGYGGSSSSLKSYGAFQGVNYQSSYSGGGGAEHRLEKEYKEPWDYYSNYPVTLPLRRPYLGNPELLDEEEFGEAAESSTYDECSTKPAIDLGLMGDNMEEDIFFLQLPASMPMVKQQPNAESNENETSNNSKSSKSVGPKQKVYNFNEVPAGLMGKLLVYKSGAVKLKLGDTLYEVSEGLNCVFAQDVVAVNTEEKFCCSIGELNKRAIITPDVDHMLDGISDL